MPNLNEALTRLRNESSSESEKGRRFERMLRRALEQHHFFSKRFTKVWLWHEWLDRPGRDLGIDLVAEEPDGGLCAIQCKFYSPDATVPKSAIDSFLTASEPEPFTSRILVNTGAELRGNALSTLEANSRRKHCRVLGRADLDGWPVDWLQHVDDPESLRLNPPKPYDPHPFQSEAIDAVCAGFEGHDRGKLILPCGTGKTVVTLWIAERQVGVGGRVLYLVPSIALMAQTMSEWSKQNSLPMHFEGICSDTRVGRTDEDVSLLELDHAVTTDAERILAGLRQARPNAMTVVFCTYHSLQRVADAQRDGAMPFDLVICDEAHRTTGVEVEDRDTSPFLLVHNAQRIRARKRLYITATPRIYTEATRRKAQEDQRKLEIFSMDDETVYGPEFYRMSFADAVEGEYLSDYRVVILQRRESAEASDNPNAVDRETGLRLEDVEKLHGCWDALADPEGFLVDQKVTGDRHNPLLRAIAFMNTIARSKKVQEHWGTLIENSRRQTAAEHRASLLPLDVQHVDGTQHSLDRQKKLTWLREIDAPGAEGCRVLTNARCLSEGVDVPALDAVLFLEPRKSQVDVVQAVGRVMRKAPGTRKKLGYIILPVVISPGQNPEQALNNNKTFQVVWSVLRALRSHDERLDLEINSLDLNEKSPEHIIIHTPDPDDPGDLPGLEQLELDLRDIPPGAIYARIVEKCGDRKYWPQWAEDVAGIADSIRGRIDALLADSQALDADLLEEQDGVSGEARALLDERFRQFLADLQRALNPELRQADAVAMLAQHLITAPVFEALFSDYDFVQSNPVSRAMSRILLHLEAAGLKHELRGLEPFYDSVRRRAGALDNAEARQKVLLELYERFFKVALRKDAERLGIVYTPVEVVDFILKSADHALQKHLGRRLSDENVHILDPFTGTGTFIVRLLQNPDLIRDEDLLRKFSHELHANEIVLLAYYIAAINIEEAYHGRLGMDAAYQPFEGIAFSDTFQQFEREQEEREREKREELKDFNQTLPVNSERVQRQMAKDITVIVGNPPYSAGQQSAADDNPNVSYKRLYEQIEGTYAARSKTTLKRHIYDSYKLAIRWASDRIGSEGVVAFVTNGSFIDGNADAGLRACLAEEFSQVYVVNLRGNARTSGERRRREKDNVFGVGTRTPVAIMVLARDSAHSGPAEIHYLDIGDYLSREDKLKMLEDWTSIAGVADWQVVRPDIHNDWLDQRDPTYQAYLPLGSKEAKRRLGIGEQVLYGLFSLGSATNRDAYLYDFDCAVLAHRVRDMIEFYEERRHQVARDEISLEIATRNDAPKLFRWDANLRDQFRRKKTLVYEPDYLRLCMYRPFVKKVLYFDPTLMARRYRMPALFPTPNAKNFVMGVTGKGATTTFSVMLTDITPDLEVVSNAQWFARWRYERLDASQSSLLPADLDIPAGAVPGYRRVDNLTDWGLAQFRERYPAQHITKDDVWHYIYGLLHAPDYREKYRADLSKDLPRIPFAPDFAAFCRAGEQLAALHLGYETCAEYGLQVEIRGSAANPYRLDNKGMKWGGTRKKPDRSVLHVNQHISLDGIPPDAHDYVVNGRTPLEWAIDRLKVTTDNESGIVSDPNAWFADDPAGLVAHLRRLVHVSVETARIVGDLPAALE
ncbi:MAG: DEAD/DEAH box helicase family protein [Anaerolineaceae bacterium]|nr:DEAD/DEAH box helicase family protein [Anaerolineaceae bacterium]